MILENTRKRLNDYVKDWGNKKTPYLHGNFSLGNFLTQEMTPRKIGIALGITAPYVLAYCVGKETGSSNHYADMFNTFMNTVMISAGFTIAGLPIFGAAAGNCLGEKVEKLLEKSPKSA